MSRDHELYEDGLRLATRKDFEGARTKLREALEENPGHADALEILGVVYERLGLLDDAIATTKKLVEIAPNSIMGHANLSRYYMLKDMIPEAEEEQGKARMLGWKAELAEAKESPTELPASGPGLADLEIGDLAAQQAELERRIKNYQELVELDVEDPMSHYSLGTAYEEAYRHTEAETHLREAVRLDPQYSAAFLALGRVLRDVGKIEAAREVFRQGIAAAEEKGDLQPMAYMEKFLREMR